ncbi:MAG: ferric reductase-like transmembrane domain-containing protein [Leptospirales bacterium]|nr:ferric reductase-like transmembrane domain-containing protein [Leptospirales bacterium]
MSNNYRIISWNPFKIRYDLALFAVVAAYLIVFGACSAYSFPQATAETIVIRASGSCALLLLHAILCIGPLTRLHPAFLPLLYNRRHLGVAMFLLALVHGLFSLIQFHGFGDEHPLASVWTLQARVQQLSDYPFQIPGFLALGILATMAASSHDFWLAQLRPQIWKLIHFGVYVAYALLILHVSMGALQSERDPLLIWLIAAGLATVCTLHLISALRERSIDRAATDRLEGVDGLVRVCAADQIALNRARIIAVDGERIAIFRHAGGFSAVSNVCRHQLGPLGEGQIVDGCITCPWHGYQYRPEDGRAPPPFREKLETYALRIVKGIVYVDPRPKAPGTLVEPATLS